MSIKPIFPVLLFVGWLSACGDSGGGGSTPPKQDSLVQKDSMQMVLQTQGNPILLVVSTQQAIIREKPQLTAPELRRAQKGDSLLYTNMVTDFAIKMRIDGIEYNEPWLRVILNDNRMGWIYGGCVRFDGLSHAALAEIVLDQRLRQLFGSNTADMLIGYQHNSQNIGSQAAFDLQMQQAEELRQTMEAKIEQHLSFLDTAQAIPDFFWLNGCFSGFVTAFPPQTQRYQLFRDFRYWQRQASQSPEVADDSLVAVFLAAYPNDSIEYLFADWTYYLSETESYSRLGEGIHHNIIAKMNTVVQQNPQYKVFLQPLQRRLMDDISLSKFYWQPLPKILAEIDLLLSKNYAVITNSDRIELSARRKMLQKFAENGIEVNKGEN